MFSFSEIIDMAVRIEKNGEKTYLAALEHIEDAGMKQMLEWMAKEERNHATWFDGLKKKTGIISDDATLREMNETLVRDYLGDQTFSLKEVDFSAVTTTNDLIRIFIEFEKDTILFYDLLVAFVPDEAIKGEIRQIVQQEETHVAKLNALIDPESE